MSRRPFPFQPTPKTMDVATVEHTTINIETKCGTSVDLVRAKSKIAPRRDKAVVVDEQTVPWPSPFTPNAFLRHNLFGSHRTSTDAERVFEAQGTEKGFVVADNPQYRIEYVGDEALNADDLLVFLVCCAVAREAGDMGALVPISLTECNRYLWKSKSGRNNQMFRESLERLYAAYFRVRAYGIGTKRQRFLADYENDDRDPSNPIYWIRFSTKMAPLFEADATEIDIVYMAHLKSYLARWCLGFYSTHDGKRDFSVSDLQKRSGSMNQPLFKFRAKLREAIEELMETKTITNDKGEVRTVGPLFAHGTKITGDDMLHVVKASRSMMLGPKKADDSKTEGQEVLHPVQPIQAAPAPTVPSGPFEIDGTQDPFPQRAERTHTEELDTRSAAEKSAARQRSRVAL
ncbi:hypothetical protein [Burkholderia vietnamiensis]|uniref:hypothetical protein n=1 Tax=Burkholderia vietnamiensis TaxID=60552 RepID=UPI001D15A10E|nr:hypothetical protein [Burkholderia vietnamiensis]UEC01962.1 hypothetical protein LK462_08040 [Burkholderia vietnamiensis]